jgi:competence protein ComEC
MKSTFVVLMYALAGCLWAQERPLEIFWIDVEGGAATLIVTPSGESLLVDTGQDLERDVSRVHDVAVRQAGLKQIDHFVATHWHADHYGGISKLSKRIPVKHFYDHDEIPAQLPDDPAFPQLIQLYRQVSGERSKALKPGDTIPLRQSPAGPRVSVECLASNRRLGGNARASQNSVCAGRKPVEPDKTDNANSVLLKLTYGKFTFLDGGDLTRDVEEQLVCPVNRIGAVDLYLTDGHGMDGSNSAIFVHSIRPRVVVVNNGPMKGADLDTMKTLLSSSGIETVWQVHRNLNAGASNTRAEFIANEKADCGARFIKAAVQPNGAFSVRIDATGAEKVYQAR